jgi:predicted phosphodiesterase
MQKQNKLSNKLFVGDVHAKWHKLARIIYENPEYDIIQVGDFGIGFGVNIPKEELPENFYFIRGNHDKESECAEYSNYLGLFGYSEKLDIFYVGGAYSIDKSLRTPYLDWWDDEELNYTQSLACIDLYEKIKPAVVVSHDCPFNQRKILLSHVTDESNRSSSTVRLLDELYSIHQPTIWIHGHLHIQQTNKLENTLFVGLKELGCVKIDTNLNVLS